MSGALLGNDVHCLATTEAHRGHTEAATVLDKRLPACPSRPVAANGRTKRIKGTMHLAGTLKSSCWDDSFHEFNAMAH